MTAPETVSELLPNFRTQSCGGQPILDLVGDLVATLRQGDAAQPAL
jgi:hypothetical protein